MPNYPFPNLKNDFDKNDSSRFVKVHNHPECEIRPRRFQTLSIPSPQSHQANSLPLLLISLANPYRFFKTFHIHVCYIRKFGKKKKTPLSFVLSTFEYTVPHKLLLSVNIYLETLKDFKTIFTLVLLSNSY